MLYHYVIIFVHFNLLDFSLSLLAIVGMYSELAISSDEARLKGEGVEKQPSLYFLWDMLG